MNSKLKNTPRIMQNLISHLKLHKLDSVITKEAEKQLQFLDLTLLAAISQTNAVDEALKVSIIHGATKEQLQSIYSDFMTVKKFVTGDIAMADNKFLSAHSSKEELLSLLD